MSLCPLFPLPIAGGDTDKGDANGGSTGEGSGETGSRQDDTVADNDARNDEASKVDTTTDNMEDGEDHKSPPSQPGMG